MSYYLIRDRRTRMYLAVQPNTAGLKFERNKDRATYFEDESARHITSKLNESLEVDLEIINYKDLQ